MPDGISVLVPWRGDDPWRLTLKRWALERWRAVLPDAEIVEGAGPAGGPFNRSAAINEARRKATSSILIIADADTAANQPPLFSAIAGAVERKQVALPYTVYYNLDEHGTKRFLGMPPDTRLPMPPTFEHRLLDSVSGVVVVPAETFDVVGGFDERFVGWGAEDRAFIVAVETLAKRVGRVAGHVVHLWHPAPESARFQSPNAAENLARLELYKAASGDAAAMKGLVGR